MTAIVLQLFIQTGSRCFTLLHLVSLATSLSHVVGSASKLWEDITTFERTDTDSERVNEKVNEKVNQEVTSEVNLSRDEAVINQNDMRVKAVK